MTEPIIIYPNWKTEIKLTESLALRALTRRRNTDPYIRMLDWAQEFGLRIDFNDYKRALVQLRKAAPFLSRMKSGCICRSMWLRR